MCKNIIIIISSFCTILFSTLSAEIVELHRLQDLLPVVIEEADSKASSSTDKFVLIKIEDILLSSGRTLGSQKWREYVMEKVPFWQNKSPIRHVAEIITLSLAGYMPHHPVEENAADVVMKLQSGGVPVSGYTQQGRTMWYQMPVKIIQRLYEGQLEQNRIRFGDLMLPIAYNQMVGGPFEDYSNGILFGTGMAEQPELLKKLFCDSGYFPKHLYVVDDRPAFLQKFQLEMDSIGVPFTGYIYTPTGGNNRAFIPMIAHVQLEIGHFHERVPTDEEAMDIVREKYPDCDPDQFFFDLLDKMYGSVD